MKKAVLLLLMVVMSKADQNSEVGLQLGARLREMPIETPKNYEDFFERLSTNSLVRLELRVRDRISPIRVWLNELGDPRRPLMSKGQVIGTMKSAFREMTIETSLVQDSQDWLRDFIEGTIGNTEEEEISIMSDPVVQYSQDVWRQETTHKIKWGIRPFRWPDPYVYVSGQLGHLDGREMFVWHIRYHLHKFTGQRVELLISEPLPQHFYLTSGLLYATDKDFRKAGRVYLGTLRIERLTYFGAFFTGVEFDNKLDLVAGYYKAF